MTRRPPGRPCHAGGDAYLERARCPRLHSGGKARALRRVPPRHHRHAPRGSPTVRSRLIEHGVASHDIQYEVLGPDLWQADLD